jgi:hypothetical protein
VVVSAQRTDMNTLPTIHYSLVPNPYSLSRRKLLKIMLKSRSEFDIIVYTTDVRLFL